MVLIEKELTIDEALDIFNINKIPSQPELKSIYKKLALKFHPDRNPNNKDLMYLINDAYDVLINYKGEYEADVNISIKILKPIVYSINTTILIKYLENYIYPLKHITKEKHNDDTYDRLTEIYNEFVSFFIEYNFEYDNDTDQVYFIISTWIEINKTEKKLYAEMYQYPNNKSILTDGSVLFPNKQVVQYIKELL